MKVNDERNDTISFRTSCTFMYTARFPSVVTFFVAILAVVVVVVESPDVRRL